MVLRTLPHTPTPVISYCLVELLPLPSGSLLPAPGPSLWPVRKSVVWIQCLLGSHLTLIGTSSCPQQALQMSPYLGLWSLWTERPQDQVRKKLTIKITTKCFSQGRSTTANPQLLSPDKALPPWTDILAVQRTVFTDTFWEEIYIFKEHFGRSSDTTCYSALQLPYWKKSDGIWITSYWLHPLSVFSDCFPHPLVSRGYHHMHGRFTLTMSSPKSL